jgi:hypothetical protein
MLGLEEAVSRLGYIAETSVPDLLAAADVVVNLRYPTAGETSASLLRILAAGKAVIVSRAGSMAEVPTDACVQVAPDAAEEEVLAEVLLRLLGDEPLRRRLEGNARAFVERDHQLAHSATAYLRVLGRLLGRDLPVPDWPSVIVDARAGGATLAPPHPALAGEPPAPHPLADTVADAIAWLRLERTPAVPRATARAMVALGLAPGQEQEQ